MNITINTDSGNLQETIILPFLQDQVDFELIAQTTGMTRKPSFEAGFKSVKKLFDQKEREVYLLGLGNAGDRGRWHLAFLSLIKKEGKNWKNGLTIKCEHLDPLVEETAALGFQLAGYNVGVFKSDIVSWPDEDFTLHIPSGSEDLIRQGLVTGETLASIMALVDAPGNKKPPSHLGEWALRSGKQYGYEVRVLEGSALREEGFHALLAVGQGSAHPPVLIQSIYRPEGLDPDSPVIGLVGKGVTFDTGGLSIKKAQNMHYMKSDMGGAAAVLGAVELAARLKLPVHIVGIVGSAENAVDANSYRPGDVIDSYSGKTIEIIDTDAEGRLILADAICYINRKFKPHWLIDLATLTGSAVMALGYASGALFSNDEHLASGFVKAGEKVRERVWRMPLYSEFNAEIESDVADVRNLSGKAVAGAITAAKFLEYFTEEHPRWAHLDIAGVAFGDTDYAKMKSATGFGPRLLIEVIRQLTGIS